MARSAQPDVANAGQTSFKQKKRKLTPHQSENGGKRHKKNIRKSTSAAALASNEKQPGKQKERRDAAITAAKKKKRSQFEACRELSAKVADLPLERQGEWLWQSFSSTTKASFLERGPLKDANLAQLPAPHQPLEGRIKQLVPNWKQALCTPPRSDANMPALGAPAMLILSGSAVAANDAIKLLPTFNKAVRVGKLFAKHIKQSEQQTFLQQNALCIASGTPHRLSALAQSGALHLDRLQWLLLDVTLDVKQRTMLDLPETCRDFWALYGAHLKELMEKGQLKVCLFTASKPAS